MIKKIFYLLFGIVFLITGCGHKDIRSLSDIKKSGKLIVGVKYDTYLFGYKDPTDNQVKGFEIDLAKLIAKRLLGSKNKIIFKEVNSKTRARMVKSGDVDMAIATTTITERRKKEVDFSRPYFSAEQSLLVPRNSSIKGIDDTRRKVVAAVKGATSGKKLKEKVPEAGIELYENYADAFTALRARKVDALTTDDSILMGMQQQDKRYKIVAGGFIKEPYGIGLAKGNTQLLEFVNDFLHEIWDDGTYQDLYQKWFNKEPDNILEYN